MDGNFIRKYLRKKEKGKLKTFRFNKIFARIGSFNIRTIQNNNIWDAVKPRICFNWVRTPNIKYHLFAFRTSTAFVDSTENSDIFMSYAAIDVW